MKYQAGSSYKAVVKVMTPLALAKAVYDHFGPTGSIMEPCRGDGVFYDLMPEGAEWCEIDEGRDFFDYEGHTDWIITNPPWGSKGNLTGFMNKAFEVADNVVFLMTINHAWTHARLRLLPMHAMHIAEIAVVTAWPKSWQSSGLQLGAVHWKRGLASGTCRLTRLSWGGEEAAAPKRSRSPMSGVVTLEDTKRALIELRTLAKNNGWLPKLLSAETKALLKTLK